MRFPFRVRWMLATVLLLTGGSALVLWLSGVQLWRSSDTASRPVVRPPAADGGWLARVHREIAEREYEASRNRLGLQAPNRAHDLRTYFDASGIRVHDRRSSGGLELLALSLAAVGRPGQMDPVKTGEVESEGARVEIRRPGLVEWYQNSSEGLEQGFTIEERIEGEGPLLLELAVEGPRASLRGDRVLLQTESGRRLVYGKLAALDAKGRDLSTRFEVAGSSVLRLVIEDEGAAYPVLIDPLLTAAADARLESEQLRSRLGAGVAGAGDVNGDGYDDVIVGAHYYDSGESMEGAAFVFLGSASGVADGDPGTAAAQLESDQAYSGFGYRVAGAGDVNGDGYDDVIVGAYAYDAGEADEGAAFVFLGSGSGIVSGNASTASAQIESNQQGAGLGASVAGAGDVNGDGYDDVIVGAPDYSAGEPYEGAAFVFLGSASGVTDGDPSTAATQLESNVWSGNLGASVAGAGDVNGDRYADVIVGFPSYYSASTGYGAVLIFHGSASGIADGTPSSAPGMLVPDRGPSDLGESVAGAGDVNGDGFDDVIVGAPWYEAGELSEGAAFVFLGGGFGVGRKNFSAAAARLESDQQHAMLGESVAGAGDVNGDGFADVIVGCARYEVTETEEGAAFVFLGSASGIVDGDSTSAAVRIESSQRGAHLGNSVAAAGDVNGDGFADVIVGAINYDAPDYDEGAAFVYLGGPMECVDRVDNDGDGLADHPEDRGCAERADESERSPLIVCDDGNDNDGDGLADYPDDPGCFNPGSSIEEPACQDGVDNDGDGRIDFDGGLSALGYQAGALDLECTYAWQLQEARRVCGLGVELTLLMPPLVWLWRRSSRGDARRARHQRI